MEFAGEPFFKFMAYERAAETIENAGPVRRPASPADELQEAAGHRQDDRRAHRRDRARPGPAGTTKSCAAQLSADAVRGAGGPRHRHEDGAVAVRATAASRRSPTSSARVTAGALSEIRRLGKKSIENIRRGMLAYKGRSVAHAARPRAAAGARDRRYLRQAHPPATSRFGRQRAPQRADGRRHRHRLHVARRRRGDRALHGLGARRSGAGRRRRPKPASGSPAACKSTCAFCPRTSTAICCSTSPAAANTTSSCARLAVRKSLRVSENGIVDLASGEITTCRTEEEVYARARARRTFRPKCGSASARSRPPRAERCRNRSRARTCAATFTCTAPGATAPIRSKR